MTVSAEIVTSNKVLTEFIYDIWKPLITIINPDLHIPMSNPVCPFLLISKQENMRTVSIIPAYIINLKHRMDRKRDIIKEFAQREEFRINIIEAKEHKVGSIGLWNSIIHILQHVMNTDEEMILICEDDHQFSKHYTADILFQSIAEAADKDVDVLLGGVSWFSCGMPVSPGLFWIEKFSGLQFTIIFRKCFDRIMSSDFKENDAADYKISSLTDNKMVIHPFISTQKEFGYSDATTKNNKIGHVSKLFSEAEERLFFLKNVASFYREHMINIEDKEAYQNIAIPTYIINLPERKDRLAHIQKQFENKSEFDITIMEACRHKVGAVGLWNSILKIINLAVQNEDDVIIICEDDHEFTKDYSSQSLIKNIIAAHRQGADILCGGIGGFNQALYMGNYRYWIDFFWGMQFTVLYKSIFEPILKEPFGEKDTADGILSAITGHKMVLYPFISVQRDFGYSDVTRKNNEIKGLISDYFKKASQRLEMIQRTYSKYNGRELHY